MGKSTTYPRAHEKNFKVRVFHDTRVELGVDCPHKDRWRPPGQAQDTPPASCCRLPIRPVGTTSHLALYIGTTSHLALYIGTTSHLPSMTVGPMMPSTSTRATTKRARLCGRTPSTTLSAQATTVQAPSLEHARTHARTHAHIGGVWTRSFAASI